MKAPFKKKIFQSTISEFYNITESALGKECSALFRERACDLPAITLSASSNTGVINGQTPLLMSAGSDSLCYRRGTQKESTEDSV